MLQAGGSCSLWRKKQKLSTWSELFARAGLGEDSLPAMDEGGSVFFGIFPLGILISSPEKYNPCLVGIFSRHILNKITRLERLGSAEWFSVFPHIKGARLRLNSIWNAKVDIGSFLVFFFDCQDNFAIGSGLFHVSDLRCKNRDAVPCWHL